MVRRDDFAITVNAIGISVNEIGRIDSLVGSCDQLADDLLAIKFKRPFYYEAYILSDK